MNAVVEVRGLTKKFGDFYALKDFDLKVEAGTIHGFLGPNGAGKSTTIRTLLGVLHPTSGTVRVLGEDPHRTPQVLKRVGYVPGDVALWPSLTGAEVFRALESLRGRKSDRARETELIEAFKLDPSKKTREYSTGNRRKVSLIAALSIGADLLILDEPTAGLDPLMEQVFVEQVRVEQQRGASVLLSSHIMSEVEKLCSEVTIIRDGQVAETGRVETLRHLSSHEITARLPSGEFRKTVAKDEVPSVLADVLRKGGTDITATPASIEEVFLSHYGDE